MGAEDQGEHLGRVTKVATRLERLKATAPYFRSFGFTPATVIDVGVHTGTPWLYRAFPDAAFHLIDPLPEVAELIAPWAAEITYTLHPVAVGSADGEARLNIPLRRKRRLANMTSVSVRTADNIAQQRVTGMEQVTASVRRLDDVAAEWRGPLGLKVDTEGHELEVIAGGAETIRRCQFVVLEVSLQNRFEGGYRFSEVMAAMADLGFEAVEFLSGLSSRPLITDILFVPLDEGAR